MNDESKGSPSEAGPDDVVRAEYDWSSVSPSTAVVETVAVAVDRDPTELDSLYDSLEPDALDALLRQDRSDRPVAKTRVSFTFAGRRVTVHSTGDVVVRPDDNSE